MTKGCGVGTIMPPAAPASSLDACRLLILADTLQSPAAFRAYDDPPFMAPSIDLAVQFHRLAPEAE